MRSIAIVTDSSAALPASCIQGMTEAGGFALVDLPVSIAGQTLAGMSPGEVDAAIVTAHVQGEQVITSSPAPGAFLDVYEELASQGYSSIISLHLSAALSGTCDSARVAASMVDIPVAVVDSENLAMALGQAVLELYKATETLDDISAAVELAEELSDATRLFFFIPTLEALKRGGRVNPGLAMVGQMFQIRPVASVSEGKLVYLERPRTTPKAIERLTALTLEHSQQHILNSALRKKEPYPVDSFVAHPTGRVVAVHFCGNLPQAEAFKESLGQVAEQAELLPLPPVLSAHSGLGALAAVVY
ncbi:MAG: DegV family protein [Rothia sp. (in: high G+C Gram-positive bacteria)]|nr:DegV family protein [Rothia sp. (in: high G+C Gram-positive bacteria)]